MSLRWFWLSAQHTVHTCDFPFANRPWKRDFLQSQSHLQLGCCMLHGQLKLEGRSLSRTLITWNISVWWQLSSQAEESALPRELQLLLPMWLLLDGLSDSLEVPVCAEGACWPCWAPQPSGGGWTPTMGSGCTKKTPHIDSALCPDVTLSGAFSGQICPALTLPEARAVLDCLLQCWAPILALFSEQTAHATSCSILHPSHVSAVCRQERALPKGTNLLRLDLTSLSPKVLGHPLEQSVSHTSITKQLQLGLEVMLFHVVLFQ